MQLPNVEQLDSEDKNWFARAIAGMVVADGRVDESETAFLKEALGFLEDRSQVEEIMGIVKQGKPPEMPAAKIDSKQAFIMLKYLSELMVADAHLSPGEVRFFLYSGRLLGFTPDILTKLWKTARAQLEATLPKAVAQIGNQTVEITLTELHDSKFSFRFGQALTPNCKIILKLHRSDGSFWDPIACRMAGQHQDKFDQNSFSILGKFGQKVAEPHGILQILHPDQFTGHDENILKPNKDSLMGRLVHCFLCNEPRVPHYVLRSRSMITAPNIFGVPAYEKPAGNLQFCDYNLIQITTCPKCGFSTNDLSFFKKQNTDEPPFNVEKLNEVWGEKSKSLFGEAQKSKESYFTEDRNVNDALLSYDLAILSMNQLAELEKDPKKKINFLRKVASLLLFQAEVLMENQQRSKAESNLEEVVKVLEPVFQNMEGAVIIRTALLIFQIKIYFGDTQSAAQYMKFMDGYDPDGKLDPNGEEAKELKISSNKLKAVFDDREILNKDSLNRFHLDE